MRRLAVLLVAGWLSVNVLQAIPAPTNPIPVTKLVAVLGERVRQNPDDLQAVFTLGRVHYFAFAGATDSLHVHGTEATLSSSMPLLSDYQSRVRPDGDATRIDQAARVAHAHAAVTHLMRAVTLAGRGAGDNDGRYALTLASALEDGAEFAPQVPAQSWLGPTAADWRESAIIRYGHAFDAGVARDTQVKYRPERGPGLANVVSFEASHQYRRLIEARGGARTEEERARLQRMDAYVAQVSTLPHAPITPIIFSIERAVPLPDLISDRLVAFDLDGTARPQTYPWVKADTALLVWDPAHRGVITSGRQLFGSVTWWMFWNDGYQALDVLDTNRDGWVGGVEAAGLALWFDRDTDGVSDPGEVVALAKTTVSAIASRATGLTAGMPMNAAGVRLTDGRTLPSYDWTVVPAVPPVALPAGAPLVAAFGQARVAPDGVTINADGDPQYSTFSLCAIDPATGQSGAAVTTRVPFVGRAVPHVRAGVGAVCTQASTVVEYGARGLDLLAKGTEPQAVLEQLLATDAQRESRQVGLIDMKGRAAAHTGTQNGHWAGSRQGTHYTVQANIMVGPEVIEAVAASFEASEGTGMPLAERMILALEAGQAKGGDRRWGNLQSAAIKIADPKNPGRGGDFIALAIEVGEHAEPVGEMKRIYYTTARRLGYRTFSRVDGADVVELKRMLHALGYWRPSLAAFPDAASTREFGLYDEEAIAAVDKFRAEAGLNYQGSPAGLVDARLVEALRAAYFKKRKAG